VEQIVFSYSVEWVHQSHIKYDDRMKRYEDSAFLPSTFEIHWLSIINSFVLVLLLTAFLAIILMRILKKDFSRYMEVDEVSVVGVTRMRMFPSKCNVYMSERVSE
jgi:hypothetical protein